MIRFATLLLATTLFTPAVASAIPVHDEASDGDLSNTRFLPTAIALAAGSNEITGNTIVGDLDYFTLSVPTGLALEAITLTSFVSTDIIGFLAIQSGTVFTEPPVGTDTTQLLGWMHTAPLFVGSDILDNLAAGPGAMGFSTPLPAGDYVFWTQQTGPELIEYGFDFIVTPEPTTAALLMAGVAFLASRPRRSA